MLSESEPYGAMWLIICLAMVPLIGFNHYKHTVDMWYNKFGLIVVVTVFL